MLLARYALALALIGAIGLGSAAAQQPAQVEAVPEVQEFDMWDLEDIPKDAINLPPALDLLGEEEDDEIVPPEPDNTDRCRHFTAEQRRNYPTLCGPNA